MCIYAYRPRLLRCRFRRLRAIVHNLVTSAGLLGRVPVLTPVPCTLVVALQKPAWTQGMSRFGISHASFIATGDTLDTAVCHIMPGSWRPEAVDQCYHNGKDSGG